jgi:hypothetical protein
MRWNRPGAFRMAPFHAAHPPGGRRRDGQLRGEIGEPLNIRANSPGAS